MGLCIFDEKIRKSQAGRDGECITLSGNADEQAVGGTQGLYIKFTAGIFHAFRREGIDLQLAVVGGCHGADTLLLEMIQNGDGQCSAFGRICSGSQLIEEHQGIGIHFL